MTATKTTLTQTGIVVSTAITGGGHPIVMQHAEGIVVANAATAASPRNCGRG